MNTQTSTRELYRNRDNSPLDRLQIRRVAPSVFADREDDSRSEKYRFVSSDSLLDQMEEAGFLVVGAQEQRTRKPDGTPTRKHLIRFAHRDVLESTRDQRIEVVMINSHNGSCSYQLMAGIFRLVCTNGLIVGARIAAINIRHMGHTGEDVIAASLQLAEETSRIMDGINRMQGVELPYKRQVEFVHEAARLRLGDDYEQKIRSEALLSPRRWNDIGFTAGGSATVWQCFNRVQENLIRGGAPLKPQKDGVYRRRSLRALNGIDGNTRLNRELWDLADSYTLNNWPKTTMRRKHHLRVKSMGRTPSLTGLELSILLYLHGDFERSDEEIMAECRGIERESVRHAIRGLAGSEFIIRTKEEEFLLRSDCWLITYDGRLALKQWVSAAAPICRSLRTRVPA